MMKIITLCMLSFLITTNGYSQNSGSVQVSISEIKNSGEGTMVLMLFDTSEGFPMHKEKAMFKAEIKEFDASLEFTFEDVPYGTYALAAYQDKNENGKVDTRRLIPMPKEPVGAINLTKMGRPKFENSTFELAEEELSLRLTLVNQ